MQNKIVIIIALIFPLVALANLTGTYHGSGINDSNGESSICEIKKIDILETDDRIVISKFVGCGFRNEAVVYLKGGNNLLDSERRSVGYFSHHPNTGLGYFGVTEKCKGEFYSDYICGIIFQNNKSKLDQFVLNLSSLSVTGFGIQSGVARIELKKFK